jgi:hypothetical protein
MAKVSELAMNQASAMSLYREKSEKECLLKESRAKLESGEVPIEEIEADFLQAEKARQQRQRRLEEMRKRKERDPNGRLMEMYVNNDVGMIPSFFMEELEQLRSHVLMPIFQRLVWWDNCLFLNLMESIHLSNLKNLERNYDTIVNQLPNRLKYNCDFSSQVDLF